MTPAVKRVRLFYSEENSKETKLLFLLFHLLFPLLQHNYIMGEVKISFTNSCLNNVKTSQWMFFFKQIKTNNTVMPCQLCSIKLLWRVCECSTSVVSTVAAHTELVRTLTTAPPAKRQPASSTGNLIKIMSPLYYISDNSFFPRV